MHVLCAVDADHMTGVVTANHLVCIEVVVCLGLYFVTVHAVMYIDVVVTCWAFVEVLVP